MPDRSSGSMITVTLAAAAVAALSLPLAMAQAPAKSGAAQDSTVKTPWGEPDLQGIWTDETDTPLQRPPKYANQEFFTAAQREELDRERSALLRRDKRVERGTELDVAGAYNGLFQSYKHAGIRTSLIVDPSNGRIPSMTPQAQKIAHGDSQFRPAALQHGADDPARWSGGWRAGGSLPDQRTAGIRRPDRQLPPHRANARRHLDFLRRRPGSGLATQHRHERKSTPAEQHPPMVWRLARPLGGQHASGRCDELQCEDRLPRLP